MSVNKLLMGLRLAGIWLLAINGCTKSPFGNDEISASAREIGGNVILDDGASPENVYVWLNGFNLGTRTDENGEFRVTLPPPAAQGTPGGVSGVFTLYYYLANYLLDSTAVITRNGEFVYAKGEIDKHGKLSSPKELEKFLEISSMVNPISVSAKFSGLVEVVVNLQATKDSATVLFPASFGRPLGAILLKSLDSDSVFVFQSVRGDSSRDKMVVGRVPKTREMAFTLVPAALPPGVYEVIPHLVISHEPLPPGLLASVGGNPWEPGAQYLNIPFRRTNALFEVR